MLSVRSLFLAVIAALTLLVLAGARLEPAGAVSPDLFFSEYVEGSSNNKALEIYNGTGAPVTLGGTDGYQVRMHFNGNAAAGLTLALTGTVAPGDVYVIAHAQADAAIIARADDSSSNAGWFNGDDAITLTKGNPAQIIDSIGQAGFDPGTEWGTGLTSTADNTIRRQSRIQMGDPVASDPFDPSVEWDGFAINTFDGLGAHTVSTGGDAAPNVLSTTPANAATEVAVNSNVAITFTEAVDVAGSWFTISCGTTGAHTATVTGGPTTFTLDPDTDFAKGESCTVRVIATQVTDQDTDDPPNSPVADFTFSFTTVQPTGCEVPATHQIAQVQGAGSATPVSGQTVRTEGIVTGDFQGPGQLGGFFFQDATPDSDPATSDGLFAFSSIPVSVGDEVRVTGRAIEFNGLTELSPVNVVDVCGSGSIAPTAYDLPRPSGTTFEPVENVLLTFPEPLAATEHFQLGRFGEVTVSSDGRLFQPTDRVAPGAPAAALLDEANRRRLLIDDGSNVQNPATVPFLTPEAVRIGDTATGITGVLSFGFSIYRLQPTQEITFDRTNPRPAAPADVGGELRVASFNTLNYFTTLTTTNPNARGANSAAEFERQEAKEVAAITGLDADVIGLMEVENNGATAIGSLVDALNAATAPGTYAFISEPAINPPNEFGGTFGTDAIKVALIYRPSAVTPVGAAQTSADPIFDRPPLIQAFRPAPGGEAFTVAVNHFKSKNCGGATGLDLDQGDGQSCFNARRMAQATTLASVLDTLDVANPLIIGDLNSYTEEDPIHVLEGAGYTGLSEEFVSDADRYSFVFDALSGELDHGMASAGLLDNVTGTTIWHINADEPLILDYNTEFNPPGLYQPDAYRSSDHDPLLIGLNFNEAPSVDANGPYAVDEGGTVQLSATGSDADNDTLTYAWDLDGNGSFETPEQTVTYSAGDGPASPTVRVQVSDGALSATDEATVNIANVPPSATFVAPPTSFAGFPFSLSLTGASDPSAADTAVGFEYAFDCGDGSGYGAFSSSATASCPTSSVAVRTVRGTLRDKDGGETEYSATVAVIVTFDSLCDLTRQYSSKAAVANALCQLLDSAERARNPHVKNALLLAYRVLVLISTGSSSRHAFTVAEGETLIRLSRAL
jgi:uncharacterized protein